MTVLGASRKFGQRLADGISRAGAWLHSRPGWQRYGIAFGAGCLGALGLAPYDFFPATVLALAVLVPLSSVTDPAASPGRSGFYTGWAFGFGYFAASMYWLAFAFLVQADQFAWMIPVVVPLFMGFLGLFVGLPLWVVGRLRWRGLSRTLLLVALLSGFEFARGHILTGLPWNLFGQSLAGSVVMPQFAAWVGPYGLSVIVILAGCLIGSGWGCDGNGFQWKAPAAGLALLVGLLGFGSVRLALGGPVEASPITVAIMQPNVPQREKMDPVANADHFRRLLDATAKALPKAGEAYAIWPENAYPFLAQTEDAPGYFAELFPAQAGIISGTYRTWDDAGQTRFGNSAVFFGPTARGEKPVTALYDKHHLVPFGEYLPLKGLLKALRLSQLAPVEDGFSPGPGPAIIEVGSSRVAPLICYEDVFPLALYPRGERPDWLVVVTNDAWFGDNAGPRQHLHLARLRAIESGLPMARSANTGISALIDPYGRILAEIPLYQTGQIVEALPRPLGRTGYDRLGELVYLLLVFALLLVSYQLRVAK
ncbi:MAG: apolipoprotein N-acyltransferase [Parvularcula sp.]